MAKTAGKAGSRGAGKVAFWAHKESIGKMLEAKHTLMATFLAHKKEVNIEYAQFRRYVNEFIRKPQNEDQSTPKVETKPKKEKGVKSQKEPFSFDANSGNTDDELV